MTHNPDGSDALLAIASQLWFTDLADRGIVVTDEKLVVRAWNPWLASRTGIAATDAVGRALFEICPTIATRGLDENYRRALAGEVRILAHRFHKYLIPVVRTSATTAANEGTQTSRIVPLTSNGVIIGTMTIVEDVSDRVVSERELRNQILVSEEARQSAEHASKLKDEFLATMSHEIRTPLNAVLGWTQILRTRSSIKSLDHALNVIERNAASQLRLVEDLLDTARIISGKLRLDVGTIDVVTVVRAAIDVVHPGARAKGVEIRPHFEITTAAVDADADRLQQAIWNVMANGLKFTEAGGVIDVTITADARAVAIVIADTGEGISAEFLPFIFDRFRQADPSPSRRHGGLGLGLALARQIIELHGGSIEAASEGRGRGATFTIRLPVADAIAPGRDAQPPDLDEASLEGVVVLLVDDSDDGREMLEVGLNAFGAAVLAVSSTTAALTALESGTLKPDVLIADIGMPDSDGYELIRRVRSSQTAIRRLPAVAVTAYADPEDRIRSLAAGYQVHIAKPADPAVIAEAVRDLVGSLKESSRRT